VPQRNALRCRKRISQGKPGSIGQAGQATDQEKNYALTGRLLFQLVQAYCERRYPAVTMSLLCVLCVLSEQGERAVKIIEPVKK